MFLLFLLFFFFFFYSFMRCSPPWKQMKDILREAIVEKHHNHVLSSYRCWRCMWLRLSVCEWVFVRIHQGVIWNYFWRRRSISIANFFWYWKKKKKDHPVPLWLICSSPPRPPSHFIFRFNKFVLLWNRHIVYTQLLLRVVVNRGGLGREPEMEQGLAPGRLWYRTSVRTTLAGRKSKKKKLEQIQRLQKQAGCLFSLLAADCLMFSTAENFLIQPVVPLSDRLGHDIKLLLDTNTVTF